MTDIGIYPAAEQAASYKKASVSEIEVHLMGNNRAKKIGELENWKRTIECICIIFIWFSF